MPAPSFASRTTIAVLALLLLIRVLPAQPDSCSLHIGTNLAGPSDWGAEFPFKDLMRYARTWGTKNVAWVSNGTNPWDTNLPDSIPLDPEGWPLSLPRQVAGAETTQVVFTVWDHGDRWPAGRYVLLWEGDGDFGFWGDGNPAVVSQQPHRIELDMARHQIFQLTILRSNAADPVRNVRFLLPGTESSYQTEPFHPAWLGHLAPFSTLRFMDWGRTNSSRLRHWADRPRENDYTYTIDGIPYEWMIRLCNQTGKDAWVCIPHAADSQYIVNMARLFRDSLDPSLTLYVEYSNEIWNWIFEQTHYVDSIGPQNQPWPERIVPSVQRALDIWSAEWTGDMDRLVRVVGTFEAWIDVSERIAYNMRPGSFDAVAPAAYLGFHDGDPASFHAGTTVAQMFASVEQALEQHYWPWMLDHEHIAEQTGTRLLFYEGGQHFTPDPFGSIQPYNDSLVAMQTSPLIYDLYDRWLDSLRTLSSTPLFMNFSFIARPNGQYGSWGVLEHQFSQPVSKETTPKYQALLDNLCTASALSVDPGLHSQWQLWPQPAQDWLQIRSTGPVSPAQLLLVDLHGRTVARWEWSGSADERLPLPPLPAGMYLLRDARGTGFSGKVWVAND